MRILNRIKGCMYGGAIGDSLGYRVEFKTYPEIVDKYGDDGIRYLEYFNRKALVSDDTQMSLFTANGILNAITYQQMNGQELNLLEHIRLAYMDWLKTQLDGRKEHKGYNNNTWIINESDINKSRYPGSTCLHALSFYEGKGTMDNIINHSKGCGGVMRVAPIATIQGFDIDELSMIGAKAAALTHCHPLGYIPAYMLVCIINKCIYYNQYDCGEKSLLEIVEKALDNTCEAFKENEYIIQFRDKIRQAIDLTINSEMSDYMLISRIGLGWVGDEALAIAIYSALKYKDNFNKAIICAVNHDGDSDSTGSITGNILGAYLGLSEIPKELYENIELKEVINELSQDLYNGCLISRYSTIEDKIWKHKYIDKTYRL